MLGVRVPPGLPLLWHKESGDAMNQVMKFFNEVKAELKKVTWPTRDELIGATAIVCIVVVVFSVILGLMDAFFSYIIGTVIKY